MFAQRCRFRQRFPPLSGYKFGPYPVVLFLFYALVHNTDLPSTQAVSEMLNSHSCVGIAQSSFYIPVVIAAFAMVLQRRGNVRFPWAFLTLFSIGEYNAFGFQWAANVAVRIVGGVVLAAYQQHMDSKGWTIAAVVFQGAGLFPLLIIQVGYLMIVYVFCQQRSYG
jgi:uncharacterized membrane protein YhdT